MSIGSALLVAVLSIAPAADLPPADSPAGASTALTGRGATSQQSGRWAWPLQPQPEVVRRFDAPDQPWLPGHRGVDLAAAVGQSVLAPTDGRVSWSGVVAGRAVVVVTHENGLRSTFEPVAGSPAVGTAVARGDRVGQITATAGHCAPRTCLHWGVLRGDTYLDPLSFVGRASVILLPLS
ncbi:M23 family metallopeptidase [Terrabacter carboxydivorans]